MRRAAALVFASTLGCSFGLGETPRTLPRGKLSGAVGTSAVFNENDSQRGGPGLHNLAPQLGPIRVGLAPHVDVGVATLYGLGARADVKVLLTRPTLSWALAARAGAGYAVEQDVRKVGVAFAGLIASYAIGIFEPYGAVTFTNHWIYGNATLPPAGSVNAPRAGYGDGILQVVLGARVYVSEMGSASLEYGRWQPMQNDPGDGYAFVANDVCSLTVCVGCWSRRLALAAVGVTEDGHTIQR